MRLHALLLALFPVLVVRARTFNITGFIVPPLVHSTEPSVEISCHYDGNFTKLQIFKGTDEIFRFEPRAWPALRSHPIPGVGSISTNNCGSSACYLQLANLTRSAAGFYSCELEHDTPPYLYTKRTAFMSFKVAAPPPRRMPYVDGLAEEFGEGDEMQAVCRVQSGGLVTWLVNERTVVPLYGLRTFKYESTRSIFLGDPPTVKVQCLEEQALFVLSSEVAVARWVDRSPDNTSTKSGSSKKEPQTKISDGEEVSNDNECTDSSANVPKYNIMYHLLYFIVLSKLLHI